MKKTKICRLFSLLAVIACLLSVSTAAYAMTGPVDDGETDTLEQIADISDETEEAASEPEALTVEGNMTLVDDISGDAARDKQFITVVTKSGSYFYIIIDRATDGENTVHFLNQVDERDLLALMDEEEIEALSGTDTSPAEVSTEADPVEAEPDDTNADAETEETKNGSGGMMAVVLILALLGGGAFYYFKVLKNKTNVRGNDNLDDYDYGDEDEDDGQDDLEYPDEDNADETGDVAEMEPDNDEECGDE